MFARIREWSRRRREAWPNAAQMLGGTFHPNTRWWRRDENITATVEGAPVVLDTYVVHAGNAQVVYTRATGQLVHGPGTRMKVYKQGIVATLGKAMGMNDHDLGDPAFDRAFVVKADNAAVARRLWSAPARARYMASFETAQIVADAATIKLVGVGHWREPERLCEAARLVGELAATDLYGIAALRAVGIVEQPAGERPRAVLDTGVRVVIGAEDHDGHLVMVARADARTGEALTVAIEDGKAGEIASKLPQGAHVHVPRVGTGMLTTGDALALAWRDLELDPDRLRAGAALLGAVAAGGALYR